MTVTRYETVAVATETCVVVMVALDENSKVGTVLCSHYKFIVLWAVGEKRTRTTNERTELNRGGRMRDVLHLLGEGGLVWRSLEIA